MAETTGYVDAVPLKFALESLLGKEAWYRLKDTTNVKVWRKELLRALRVCDAAIIGTIQVVDDNWVEEKAELLEKGTRDLEGAGTIENLFAAFSACLLQLNFHLIGQMPNLRGRTENVRAIPGNWRLNTYRSILYVQDKDQKRRALVAADRRSKLGGEVKLD